MRSLLLPALGLLLTTSCGGSPVAWNAERAIRAGAGTITLTPAGDTVTSVALAAPVLPSACAGSVRTAEGGALRVAVWWQPRADSSALLLAARSVDHGASWSAPTAVDTLDRSVSGCRRPPASVAVDATSGYVHVTYGLVAPEGTGVFFAHSMDRGASFHDPVAILYGDRVTYTSVAASGDVVAVAFEDPNGTAPRVGLALSRTMGHIFEERVLPVSDDNSAATQPLVAVAGRQIAVAWRGAAGAGGDTVLRIRSGLLH